MKATQKPPSAPRQTRALRTGSFVHVSGLDLPAEVKCKLAYHAAYLSVSAMNQVFTLPNDRICSVSVSTQRKLQRQYVSSAGGAVLGAALLGPMGALLGGGARKRSIRSSTRYLIFAYRAEGSEQMKYLIFRVTKWGGLAHSFVAAYKKQTRRAKTQVRL